MKANITNEDVLNLQKEFKEYCEHAEQHEFAKLTMVDIMLERSIKNLNSIDNIARNAMFRVIYKLIGKDYSEYK
jgi:cell division protein FtsB